MILLPKGRLAPSPTGFLHLGNAWSFLWSWLWIRSQNGSIVLRIEDIDQQRSNKDFVFAIEKDLKWLGLDWDENILYQSKRSKAYNDALLLLNEHTYPCYCTRKELRTLASAPHIEDYGVPYVGTCANLTQEQRSKKEQLGRKPCLRLRTKNSATITFDDTIYGVQSANLYEIGGDFALRRSDGVIAYQLAVVIDDAYQGINHIVRGSDILASTPRQIFLQQLLNLPRQEYAHIPLLLDDEGNRLAKRHKSLSLLSLKEKSISPQRVIGLFANMAGLEEDLAPMYLNDLVRTFSFERCKKMYAYRDRGLVLENRHLQFLLG